MITAILKQILQDSGCTLVLYEQDKLANLYTDQSHQDDIVGLVIQPNEVTLEVRANAIMERFPPINIEIMKQVRLEDAADNNEVVLQALLDICKEVILRLIARAEFKKITTMTVFKIPERKYDANVIGWSMPIDLTYLQNENKTYCP